MVILIVRIPTIALVALYYYCTCCCYVQDNASILITAFHIVQQQQQPSKIRSLAIMSPNYNNKYVSSPLYMAAGGSGRGGMSKKDKDNNGSSSDKTAPAVGMGMTSNTNTKTKNGKTTSTKTTSTPFNVNASLSRLEKKYDELTKANAKVIRKKDKEDDDDDDDQDNKEDIEGTNKSAEINNDSNDNDDDDDDENNKIVTTEYVVAVRAEGYVDDWVPIAQYCLTRTSKQAAVSDGVTDPIIQAGISYYCRELSHVATLGSRIFQSIPRNLIQYSVETLDSFHKHVYETTIQQSSSSSNKKNNDNDSSNTNTMTKEDARNELELINGDGDDKSAIKRAYRTLSFAYHPDRFIGIDRTAQEIDIAHNKYLRIQLAYDTLNSGIRNENKSWYQSLGGKARTDFVGPVQLISIETGKSMLEMNNVESAITCMSPSIVQTFVARCK